MLEAFRSLRPPRGVRALCCEVHCIPLASVFERRGTHHGTQPRAPRAAASDRADEPAVESSRVQEDELRLQVERYRRDVRAEADRSKSTRERMEEMEGSLEMAQVGCLVWGCLVLGCLVCWFGLRFDGEYGGEGGSGGCSASMRRVASLAAWGWESGVSRIVKAQVFEPCSQLSIHAGTSLMAQPLIREPSTRRSGAAFWSGSSKHRKTTRSPSRKGSMLQTTTGDLFTARL